uniref:Uncharacterized protein n=1 Tax=Romanomermis culicivorax TaxID=13658 RepID=A0A915JPA3_ROMCU
MRRSRVTYEKLRNLNNDRQGDHNFNFESAFIVSFYIKQQQRRSNTGDLKKNYYPRKNSALDCLLLV